MATRPTYRRLDPVRVGPFDPYQHREQVWKQERGQSVHVAPAMFNAEENVSPAAVASIHKAFTLAKTSHNGWRSFKREGRFDPRRAAGATRLEQDVFQRKTGRSTTHVKVSVLIDASGSMGDQGTGRVPNPLEPTSKRRLVVTAQLAAAVFGATVAKALSQVPTVDLDVYQHSAGISNDMYIKWRWHKGTPLAVFNEAATLTMPGGGNADGHALFAITSRMLKEIKRDEKGVILIVSDGMPSVYARDGQSKAGQALIDAVAHARKNGIEVIAVAIDGSDQSIYYGKDGVLPFNGDWGPLGTGLAKHIGAALARR